MRYESIIGKFMENSTNSNVKILGLGGGGCNAVESLYKRGLEGVTYAVCNADLMSLKVCCVPTRLAIGELGSGDMPENGHKAAEEHAEEIRKILSDGTEMLFVTAGMGGGTGTGAAPVVARIARELGILTVGIVTTPFEFEGKAKMTRARGWIQKMERYVDATIVINNEKLTNLPGYSLPEAFSMSDKVLADAVESVVMLVLQTGKINVDFADIRTTLQSGKRAVISTGEGEGEGRMTAALRNAVDSILTDEVDLSRCNRLLLNLYCSHDKAITMKEVNELTAFTGGMTEEVNVKYGVRYEDSLGERVKVTVMAVGDW